MATRTWIGGAEAVQQVTTVTVGGTLNMQQACTLRRDLNNLTITTLNESGPFQVSGYGAPATFSRR